MCICIYNEKHTLTMKGTNYMRPRYCYVVHRFHTPNKQLLRSMEIFRGWAAFKVVHGGVFKTQDSLYNHLRRTSPFVNKSDPRSCYHIQKIKALVPVFIQRSKSKDVGHPTEFAQCEPGCSEQSTAVSPGYPISGMQECK